VLPQGAEFSFASVGDFSEANGFVDGYAIVSGRMEKVIGGGLCQVSTTLFRAVSNAGLQVTRRVGHSHVVYFYENILGFDATVYVPSTDFRWRNDSPATVYIVGTVDRSTARMTFQIWGQSDGRQVKYDGPYTKNWTQPGAPVWQYDPTIPKGAVRQLVHGRPGVDVNYYRTITFADGTTRRDTYYTHYTPWEDFYLYGPDVTPPDGAEVIPPRS
jgi:vancomycin resistance protein YoaR